MYNREPTDRIRTACSRLSLLVLPSVFLICSSASVNSVVFISKDYGFSVLYPSDWRPGTMRKDDPLDIVNFSPLEAVHAAYLPPRGAEIMIGPPMAFHLSNSPQTLEAWIGLDASHRIAVSEHKFALSNAPAGVGSIIEVRTRGEEDPVVEGVDWYFRFHDKLFKAMLLYRRGNPNAEKLLQTMQQITSSLKLRE